jgi:hypothetical protein
MQDSCSCAHTNLLTNGLQCPSSVPYNATAEVAFLPISGRNRRPDTARLRRHNLLALPLKSMLVEILIDEGPACTLKLMMNFLVIW